MGAVYIVIKSYPTYDLVDDDLDIVGADVGVIAGVFWTRKRAESFCCEKRVLAQRDVEEFGCDPVEYSVAEWEAE